MLFHPLPKVVLYIEGKCTVVPITHTASKLPIAVPIADKKDSFGKVILDGNVLLGNITCVSKARLGDYITDLTVDEMKSVDKAISISLDINHHYQTLQNMYDDKLQYNEETTSEFPLFIHNIFLST